MPDITITVTVNQAQRISAAFGPTPVGMTESEWVVKNTKRLWKDRVKAAESSGAANTAFDAAVAQAEADFGGF